MAKSAFETFLAGHDPKTAALSRRLRALLRRQLPNPVESADRDNWAVGRSPGYHGTVFVISPQKGYINLGVVDGASLPDPGRLLEGSGKRHRHIKLRRPDQLADPALFRLLQAAVRRHGRADRHEEDR